jgi:hypothetical protein
MCLAEQDSQDSILGEPLAEMTYALETESKQDY